MSNEIEKFDPSKLMDGVRDRIKSTFVSLIPDAQWEQLVQSQIDKFFTVDLEQICKEMLKEVCKEKIKETLKIYDTGIWDCDKQSNKATELLKNMLIANAPQIFASMFEGLAMNVIQNMRNRNY